MYDLDILDEKEFCEWLANEVVDEDDDRIIVNEILHRLIDIGYLTAKDVADRQLHY